MSVVVPVSVPDVLLSHLSYQSHQAHLTHESHFEPARPWDWVRRRHRVLEACVCLEVLIAYVLSTKSHLKPSCSSCVIKGQECDHLTDLTHAERLEASWDPMTCTRRVCAGLGLAMHLSTPRSES